MTKPVKISITGPESTGKSILATALNKHYASCFVPDYSRTYFTDKPLNNNYEDIILIAKEQIRLELEAVQKAEATLIICDTDLINIKIWLEYYAYKVPDFIEDHLQENKNDLSLLLYPNTTWEADGLRKNAHDRIALFDTFQRALDHYNYPFRIIKKLDTERLHQAIIDIDQFLEY